MSNSKKQLGQASSPGTTNENADENDHDTLAQQREASGGLPDDPTESGNPVRNRVSFKNLTGGR